MPLRIGGYEVIARWQAQRKRRTLSAGEAEYLNRLEAVACETARLQSEIDRAWTKFF